MVCPLVVLRIQAVKACDEHPAGQRRDEGERLGEHIEPTRPGADHDEFRNREREEQPGNIRRHQEPANEPATASLRHVGDHIRAVGASVVLQTFCVFRRSEFR